MKINQHTIPKLFNPLVWQIRRHLSLY